MNKKMYAMSKKLCLLAALLALMCAVCACGDNRDQEKYVFVSGGVTLEAGAPAGDAIERLGEPIHYAESGSCGGIPGLDKVYAYQGFTVYTTPGTDGDTIAKIELTDDSVKTPEGLTIGSTEQAVTDALGVGENAGAGLVYTAGNTKLTFVLRDGKVTNIQYAAK